MTFSINALLTLISILIFLGGYVFNISSAKIELGTINAFAVLLSILIIFYRKKHKTFPPIILNLIEKLTSMDKKKFFYLFFFFLLSFFLAHTFKYLSFNVSGEDQAYVHQGIKNGFNNLILQCDVCAYGSYMGEHTSPILLFLTPIFKIFNSHIMIYLIEVLIVFGAIYLFFKYILKEKPNLWPMMLILILCSKPFKLGLIWDFREDHFTFLFLTLSFLSLYKKKISFFLICFVLTLMTKEHLPYFLPFLSLPILLEKEFDLTKNQRIVLSVFITISSLAWLITIQKFITPYFNGGAPPSNHIVGRFPGYGSTNAEVVKNILTSPTHWWRLFNERVLDLGAWKYIFTLFAPFILIFRRRWFWVIAASPIFMMNMLSYIGNQRSMAFHYDLAILPLFIFALFLEVKEIKSSKKLIWPLLIALCFAGRWPNFYTFKYWPSVANIKDRQFFASLDSKNNYTISFHHAAQIAHHERLSVFKIKKNFNSMNEFVNENRIKHEVFPAFNLTNMKYLILDLNEQPEENLYKIALKENWNIISTSQSNRFVLMEKK